ncbi:MAG: hypothetical protein GY882_03990 [Actinomycetia bacterium]|nr:hypothetical protein [Actinomycetes bacterium]MCP4843691.1 hypothetical protein [Actinomycetes bacterium]
MGRTKFATDEERKVAELLDSYGIAWDYEPKTFVLERYPDGKIAKAFTPDFYLPRHRIFIEVTVARDMNKKNRKMRLMRSEHPGVDVRLMGRRDLEQLFRGKGR